MSQQPAVKMSAAPLTAEALESAAGMLEGRQRKLESMIRDPRSPVNVESLLVRGAAWPRRAAPRGEAPGGVTKGALPSPRAGGRGKEGRKEGKGSRVLEERSWGRTTALSPGQAGGAPRRRRGGARGARPPEERAPPGGEVAGSGPSPLRGLFLGGVEGLRREPRASALRLGTAYFGESEKWLCKGLTWGGKRLFFSPSIVSTVYFRTS